MLGVILRFRRCALGVFICAAVLAGGSLEKASAQDVQTNKFLQLQDGQRYWYLEGAVATVAHLIATRDKQKGDCAASWYLKDREAKRKLIEDTLALYPAELPTTIILGLLQRACGELLPK